MLGHPQAVRKPPITRAACSMWLTLESGRIPLTARGLLVRIDEKSPYAANLLPMRWGGAMRTRRLRMAILYSEDGDSKDYFGEPARQPRESPSRRRFRVSMGKTVRTKRRNEADPSDLERFVQLTTSNEILARYKRHVGLLQSIVQIRPSGRQRGASVPMRQTSPKATTGPATHIRSVSERRVFRPAAASWARSGLSTLMGAQ